MSLDVYLSVAEPSHSGGRQAIFIRRDGANVEITRDEWDAMHPGRDPVVATVNADEHDRTEVYTANITHNLAKMAEAAGIYKALWRPEEIGITTAVELIQPLTDGLAVLRSDPARFEAFNAPNGWGKYEHLVSFATGYLLACQANPNATVSVWR